MTWLILVTTFLTLSCANKPPLVKIIQIDTKNNQANINEVKAYNKDTCKMEAVLNGKFPLSNNATVNPVLMGYFCVSPDDMAKLIKYGKTECENSKVKNLDK